ncbi:hypothetical protein B0H13DRAFT_2019289 [Mycena leptocephala]|nr:hypothetical protein B0H13DRAFT_2019289 [Mycena leptocephala]
MMLILKPGLLVFGILIAVQATVVVSPTSRSSASFPSQVIFQTPDSVFLENIAVRATSELLITSVTTPTLFALDPTSVNATLDPIYTFPNATSLNGIAEYRPGVFALAAAIIDLTTIRWFPGSIVIWSVDFNAPSPRVRALGALANAQCANGITTLPGQLETLLVADCVAGAVWQMDARTGKSRLVLQEPAMLPSAPAPALGINGLHVRDSHLYFTNSQQHLFARLALTVGRNNVAAAGAVEKLASIELVAGNNPDDFVVDHEGRAWVTVHPGAIVLLSPPASGEGNWTQLTVVGNANGTDPGLIQPTSAAFGRGNSVQKKMLYVTSSVGQVVAVNTSGYNHV